MAGSRSAVSAADESRASGNGRSTDRFWVAYKADGDAGAREQLILHSAPLVKYVASRNCPMTCGRGTASASCRSSSWGRVPSRAELAAELRIDHAQLELLRTQMELARVRSIKDPLNRDRGPHSVRETLADAIADPVDSIGHLDTLDSLAHAIGRLSERAREILTLTYERRLTLRQVGELLELTESRVCQIRIEAINKLRYELATAERGQSRRFGAAIGAGDAA